MITLACRKKPRGDEEREQQQYESTGRQHFSDTLDEPDNKNCINDIKFAVTPAHSIEDLDGTEDIICDDQQSDLTHPNVPEIDSPEKKLDPLRNSIAAI